MVRVPEYIPQVSLRPLFRQDVDVRATPESFGADIGRGAQNLAKGFDAVVEAGQLADVATVQQSRNNYLNEKNLLQHDAENGYLAKSGKSAIDAFPQYERDLAELRRKHG